MCRPPLASIYNALLESSLHEPYLSVIVFQLDIRHIHAVKPEGDALIPRDGDGPSPFPISLERMRVEARKHHIMGRLGTIQGVQHALDARNDRRRNPFRH